MIFGAELSIRTIQKNDRGRQGRGRILLIRDKIKKSQLETKLSNQRKLGQVITKDKDVEKQEMSVYIQKYMRGIMARKYVESLREEEMEFLGMIPKKKPLMNNWVDPVDE